MAQKASVLTLEAGFYDVAEFLGEQPLRSPTLPALTLTAAGLLGAGQAG